MGVRYDLIYRPTALHNLDEIKEDTQELFELQRKILFGNAVAKDEILYSPWKRQEETEMLSWIIRRGGEI